MGGEDVFSEAKKQKPFGSLTRFFLRADGGANGGAPPHEGRTVF
jgi:hypothetical protein